MRGIIIVILAIKMEGKKAKKNENHFIKEKLLPEKKEITNFPAF